MAADTDREIRNTRQWAIGIIIMLLIQAAGVIVWAGALNQRVGQAEQDIDKLEVRVDDVDSDIRAILVGIEAIKGRLGIIEQEP